MKEEELDGPDRIVDVDATKPEDEGNTATNQESLTETEQGVKEAQQKQVDPYGMDGTNVNEISIMPNEAYSQQIMGDVYKTYDLKKIQELKAKDADLFRTEGKTQILGLWSKMEGLAAHTNKYIVMIMMFIGNILIEIENSFNKKKSAYMKWQRGNFEDKHIRYFQQAKQLATIGSFAEDYAAAGKNRILQIEHQRKVENRESCYEVFQEYKLPDTTDDEDGEVLKHHLDTVTTVKRLKTAGIDFVEVDQAALISSFRGEAVGVKAAEELKVWLDEQEEERRTDLFDEFIMDKMTFPSDRPYQPAPKSSLNKLVIDFVDFCANKDFDDEGWMDEQKAVLDQASIIKAYRLINALVGKMQIDVSALEDESSEPNNNA